MSGPDDRVRGPGAAVIDAAVIAADGAVSARHHPRAPHRFRGRSPVSEVIVTRPPGHWHLVTVGLSELDAKESPDPEVSGWGFELTFRVVSVDEPLWAVELLTNLAAYVWTGRHGFAPGHHLDLRGPLRLGSDTALTAGVVVRDPGLPILHGPFGELEPLQLLGLTADELEACSVHGTEAVVEVLARRNPLLVTDLARSSAISGLRPPPVRPGPVELRVALLRWKPRRGGQVAVEIGAAAAAAIGPALLRALSSPGGTLRVEGDGGEVIFVASDPATWESTPVGPRLQVPADRLETLAGLFSGRAGSYRDPAWPGLTWHVGL